MAEEIEFENRHFLNFKSHVTLTLISEPALRFIVDVRTDVRTCTDGRTFLPGLLGHLSGDDLKTYNSDSLTEQLIDYSSTYYANIYILIEIN